MSNQTTRFVVLTGPPGCGKTTLVKKVCDVLGTKGLTVNGFFTEEVRAGKHRVGFDVVLLSGKRAPLARIRSGSCTGPFVGKYAVDIKSFELCISPILSLKNDNSVLVLDEIGKMELFSEKFKDMVQTCMNSKRGVILATIPMQTAKPIPLVEMLRGHPDTCLINVTTENRNMLVSDITSLMIKMKENMLF